MVLVCTSKINKSASLFSDIELVCILNVLRYDLPLVIILVNSSSVNDKTNMLCLVENEI